MKKLIITTCVVLSMAMFPMNNAFAKKGNPNPGNPDNNGVGGPPVYGDVSGGDVVSNINNHNVNRNTITNRNNNTNTNVQGQVQGQAQGQQQSIGDVNVNIDNSNGGSSDTRGAASENINMRGVRGFASAAEINHVGIPSYFGPATKNANVQPADTMLMFKDTFTRAEVESYLKGTSVDRSTNGEEESIFTWGKKGDPKQIIKVILTPPAKGTVIQTALITTKAKNGDTESKDVLYTALLRGLDTNSDLLLITAQGAGTIMKSFGWGIGASYTRATLSTDEATGGVSAGGLGISGGSAGYKSLPWIQSIGLRLN